MVRYLSVFLFLSFMIGCSSTSPRPARWNGNLVIASYRIADSLERNLNKPISFDEPIIVATFVNVNDLGDSSTFGRIIAEQVSSRFAQKGYRIIEMKLRNNSVFMDKGNGEFLLSRDLREISKKHKASAVIVGTYGEGYERMYVSARIVSPTDSRVLASYDLGIPMSWQQMGKLCKDS